MVGIDVIPNINEAPKPGEIPITPEISYSYLYDSSKRSVTVEDANNLPLVHGVQIPVITPLNIDERRKLVRYEGSGSYTESSESVIYVFKNGRLLEVEDSSVRLFSSSHEDFNRFKYPFYLTEGVERDGDVITYYRGRSVRSMVKRLPTVAGDEPTYTESKSGKFVAYGYFSRSYNLNSDSSLSINSSENVTLLKRPLDLVNYTLPEESVVDIDGERFYQFSQNIGDNVSGRVQEFLIYLLKKSPV